MLAKSVQTTDSPEGLSNLEFGGEGGQTRLDYSMNSRDYRLEYVSILSIRGVENMTNNK